MGDGNEDGILDSEQAERRVAAAADVDGNDLLDDYVTIVAPDGTSLEKVVALDDSPTDPAPPDGGASHHGLFDYEVKVVRGDAADVKVILPSGPCDYRRVHAPGRRVDRGHGEL